MYIHYMNINKDHISFKVFLLLLLSKRFTPNYILVLQNNNCNIRNKL